MALTGGWLTGAEAEDDGGKAFDKRALALGGWLPRNVEAELEPEVLLEAPETAETDDAELCRVMVLGWLDGGAYCDDSNGD